jgi:hypothetical protein
VPLEIQQLLAAEDSPVAAIKKQDVPSFSEIIGQGNELSLDRVETEFRENITRIQYATVPALHADLSFAFFCLLI